jgi:hypothetical protein
MSEIGVLSMEGVACRGVRRRSKRIMQLRRRLSAKKP